MLEIMALIGSVVWLVGVIFLLVWILLRVIDLEQVVIDVIGEAMYQERRKARKAMVDALNIDPGAGPIRRGTTRGPFVDAEGEEYEHHERMELPRGEIVGPRQPGQQS